MNDIKAEYFIRKKQYLIFIVILWAVIFALRVAAPGDLLDNDQERPASYILDVIKNGKWLIQHDQSGDVSSKPPLYTWLSAIISFPAGRVTIFTLYLPCALAILGISLLIFKYGSRIYGIKRGFAGALFVLLSSYGIKHVALARTDAVFAFTVFLTMLLFFEAIRSGRFWFLFWLSAAAATLAKGPLGVVLSVLGVFSVFIIFPRIKFKFKQSAFFAGLAVYLIITFGWFYAANKELNGAVYNKMIVKELVGQAKTKADVSDKEKSKDEKVKDDSKFKYLKIIEPAFYYVTRFFPWSILTIIGLWRILNRAGKKKHVQFFEIYLAVYFILALIIFCVASHKRADLLLPLVPAGAIIASNEFLLFRFFRRINLFKYAVIISSAAIVFLAGYLFFIKAKDTRAVETKLCKNYAEKLENAAGKDFPFVFCNIPFTLQFYLNSMSRTVDDEAAAEAISSEYPVYILIRKNSEFEKIQALSRNPVYKLHEEWESGDLKFKIISNRPDFGKSDKIATYIDGILFQTAGLKFIRRAGNKIYFAQKKPGAEYKIINKTESAAQFDIIITGNKRPYKAKSIFINPGEIQNITLLAQ